MISIALKKTGYFLIDGGAEGISYYGFNQEWFRTRWQRLSGCGPTAVSNILYYLGRSRSIPGLERPVSRKEGPDFMETVWRHVTPTAMGIPNTDLLCKGVQSYAKANSLHLGTEPFEIPGFRRARPDFGQLLLFLYSALSADTPVAFLNLDCGEEKILDSWHWVTVIALKYEADGSAAFAEILDEGKKKEIDLNKWFRTTAKGGGLVRFHLL